MSSRISGHRSWKSLAVAGVTAQCLTVLRCGAVHPGYIWFSVSRLGSAMVGVRLFGGVDYMLSKLSVPRFFNRHAANI